ncbi:MAG: lipopolysaccharide heptosyltransferase II [Desulfobacterales bacterium]
MTSNLEQTPSQTILVACPNWVGDVVMATPTFECLRNNYPAARIIGLIRKYAGGVVEDGPWFNDLIKVDDKTIRGVFQASVRIRRLNPDMAFVLPNSFRSALIARLGGAKKVYGYRRNGRSGLMSGGPLPRRENKCFIPRPMVDYYLEICRWLNLTTPLQTRPRLFMSDAVKEKGRRLLKRYCISPDDTVIGMNPGAQFGSSKCWPPAHFARLAELLSQHWNCKILLFIGPGEKDIGNKIVQLSRAKIINTGPDKVDLALLKPLIQRCRLLVTNDTGPRHYAVAFDIPVVVIMGPTDPRYTQLNLEKTIVLRRETGCSPCHLKECNQNHRCMTEISPEAVLQAGEQLLQEQT